MVGAKMWESARMVGLLGAVPRILERQNLAFVSSVFRPFLCQRDPA
jgi:hypothetical protein